MKMKEFESGAPVPSALLKGAFIYKSESENDVASIGFIGNTIEYLHHSNSRSDKDQRKNRFRFRSNINEP